LLLGDVLSGRSQPREPDMRTRPQRLSDGRRDAQRGAPEALPAVRAGALVEPRIEYNDAIGWLVSVHQRGRSPLTFHDDPEMLAFGEGWGG